MQKAKGNMYQADNLAPSMILNNCLEKKWLEISYK